MPSTIITGSGSYIPGIIVKNAHFTAHAFYSDDGSPMDRPAADIVDKFSKITGIVERRYAEPCVQASDMSAKAAALAIEDSGIDPETIDQIIVAHNFGDIGTSRPFQTDMVPSLASRVKNKLGILNPACIPYDLIFGCPGWLQGVIHTDAFFKAGVARTALVIGAETLSRVVDPHDRDGMIFSDGAGACILQYADAGDRQVGAMGDRQTRATDGSRTGATGERRVGLLSASVRSDCGEETGYIEMNETHKPATGQENLYIKMKGRKVYEYALRHVPMAMKGCFDAAGCRIEELKAIFIHQANEKMDEAIVRAFFALYGISDVPEDVMPMSIHWLGNSSVATIPTLYDLVRKGQIPGHRLDAGDLVLFASVGAGMNINAVCYRCA